MPQNKSWLMDRRAEYMQTHVLSSLLLGVKRVWHTYQTQNTPPPTLETARVIVLNFMRIVL